MAAPSQGQHSTPQAPAQSNLVLESGWSAHQYRWCLPNRGLLPPPSPPDANVLSCPFLVGVTLLFPCGCWISYNLVTSGPKIKLLVYKSFLIYQCYNRTFHLRYYNILFNVLFLRESEGQKNVSGVPGKTGKRRGRPPKRKKLQEEMIVR